MEMITRTGDAVLRKSESFEAYRQESGLPGEGQPTKEKKRISSRSIRRRRSSTEE